MSVASASAVRPAGDGVFEAEIHEGWDVLGNAHGGYLLAMAARAGAAAAGRPDPVSITGHFLAPGKPGPVTITTAVIGGGRRFTTATATVGDADRVLLTALGTFADLGAGIVPDAPDLHVTGPPELPPPEECVPVEPGDPFPPRFIANVELRLHPDDFAFGGGGGRMEIRGWFRFPSGEAVDPFGLILATDAFPPAVFRSGLPIGWTPTIELTAHVRARPAGGWLAGAVSTRFVGSGFLEMDAELWEPAGRLVAQGRQLALVHRG